MIIRSKAPLRIGLAGGGTDLETYSNEYGGAVLNATINMYAYCTIIPTNDNKIKIYSYDNGNNIEIDSTPEINLEGNTLILHRGVYNRIVKDFNGGKPLSFIMSTSNDAPVGSGLGTSSTMVVAILEAFNKWLGLGLDDYQKAQLAYDIERKDLKLAGGKQDQYAAVFGGFNFMEFKTDKTVIVNALRLSQQRINELECSLLLYYGGQSHDSAKMQLELTRNIIKEQNKNNEQKSSSAIDAMHNIKQNAYKMKDYVLTGDTDSFAQALRTGWENKKKTSSIVSNKALEEIISFALSHGAEAVKVSGAGGGGFLMLYCNPINRQQLINDMDTLGGKIYSVAFSKRGAESWVVNRE
ncbi:MAG: dehydrogenase [Clostridia bacterium]|nr:dehydrogenase [Clostridia bacterium]